MKIEDSLKEKVADLSRKLVIMTLQNSFTTYFGDHRQTRCMVISFVAFVRQYYAQFPYVEIYTLLICFYPSMSPQKLSKCPQRILKGSSKGRQIVVKELSKSHQRVIKESSKSHRRVIIESSKGHQRVIEDSLKSH